MRSRRIFSIADTMSILRRLLTGHDRSEVQAHFGLNSGELSTVVHVCFPGREGRVLGQSLATEEKRSMSVFLDDVERLRQVYRATRTTQKPFIIEARENLLDFFESNSYPDSGFSKKIATYCLSDWNSFKRGLGDTERALLTPIYDLSTEEACKLIVLLEKLADSYCHQQRGQYLGEMKKIRAFQLVSAKKIREAATCFSDALRLAPRTYSLPQVAYLEFFYHIMAHRADWLDLNVSGARSHLQKAIGVMDAEKAQRILNGYYWGLDDLERDKILLNATEDALKEDATTSLEEIDRWLTQSSHLAYRSPRYNHLKVMQLALRWVTTLTAQRGGIREEMMAQMATRDLRNRADLYCVHVLDSVRTGFQSLDTATRKLGRLLSPDAFPPEDSEEVTKELAQELVGRVEAPRFLPKWLVEWAKDKRERSAWRQAYALEVYACCVAEFFYAITKVPQKKYGTSQQQAVWAGLDCAIKMLESIDLMSLRKGEQLRKLTEQLCAFQMPMVGKESRHEMVSVANPSTWEIIEQTAADIFPHLVYLSQDEANCPDGVLLTRLWQKGNRILRILGRACTLEARYYYLPPWLNFYEQDTYQPDPYEEIPMVRANLYGEPSVKPVVLVCDGNTDTRAFKILLDHLYPEWRALNMFVLNGRGGGQTLKAVEDVRQFGSLFVVIQDEDAKSFFEKQRKEKNWAEVVNAIEGAPHAYLVPDIEGVNLTALVAAIKEANPRALFDEQAVLKELKQYVEEVTSGKRKKWRGGTLAYAIYVISERHWRGGPSLRSLAKGEAWGKALARKMVETGISSQVLEALALPLRIARGLK